MELVIKNMVCKRCELAVSQVFSELGISFVHLELGYVKLQEVLSDSAMSDLEHKLEKLGFEIITDKRKQIIEGIKKMIIAQVRTEEKNDKLWSELISKSFHYDYSYLSQLFSSVVGISIEQYIIRQKVEYVKELLVYDECRISEIAWKLGYSSPAHLSSQFKKVCGLSPLAFKKNHKGQRRSLDEL